MKRVFFVLAAVALFATSAMAQAVHQPTIGKTGIRLYNQPAHRTEIILPQVKGYNIYKGDFHVHTIYSDGEVTPRERVREAWYDGLDIIALTDHLELRSYEKFMLKAHAPYNPNGKPYEYIRGGAGNKKDPTTPIYCDLDATYEEALSYVEKEEIPIMVVRGTEIWRNPAVIGEYNAFFLKDITDVAKPDIIESLKEARKQGATAARLGGARQRYARYGFEACGPAYEFTFTMQNTKTLAAEGDAYTLCPIRREDTEILAYCHALMEKKRVFVRRGIEENYRDMFLALGSKESTPYLVKKNGKSVGYVSGSKRLTHIYECGFEDDRDVLYAVYAAQKMNPSERITILLPETMPAAVSAMQSAAPKIRRNNYYGNQFC